MKNFFKISLFAILFIIGTNANAQDSKVVLGVKAGLNLSNIVTTFDGSSMSINMGSKIGYNIGVTLDYQFNENLFLLTGLELTAKGSKFTADIDDIDFGDGILDVEGEVTFNPLYLQLPIHLGYKFPIGDNSKFVINAGPYLAYGIGGNVKAGGEKADFFGDEGANRFDFGFGLGGGLEFGKFKVGIGYDFGLTDAFGADGGDLKNKNGYLTFGMKF